MVSVQINPFTSFCFDIFCLKIPLFGAIRSFLSPNLLQTVGVKPSCPGVTEGDFINLN